MNNCTHISGLIIPRSNDPQAQAIAYRKQVVSAEFSSILNAADEAKEAFAMLEETVSIYPYAMQHELFGEYAYGYKQWVLADLGKLSAVEMRQIGNQAPQIADAFSMEIADRLAQRPLNALSR